MDATTSITLAYRSADDPAFAGHRPGTAAYRRVVLALFLAGLATFVLLYSTQALFPELSAAFGVSPAQSTLTLSLATAGLGLALLVAGPLSERFGRTRLIHASLWASCLLAVALVFVTDWSVFVALRLLSGVTLAGLPAVATAYLREELHPSAHARAAGLYIGGTALGGLSGRLVTGPIAELGGWRLGLAAAAVLALGCAVAVRLLLPASRNFRPVSLSPATVAAMARGALTDRRLVGLYVVGGTVVGALVAVFNALGFRLADAPFHLGLAAASLVFGAYAVGSVSAALAGRLADRYGRGTVLPLGAAVGLLGVALTLSSSLPVLVGGVTLLTVGFFATHGVASGWVPARAHAGGVATSQAASFYLFTYYVGSSVFGSLAVQAYAVRGWPSVVALSAGLLVAAVVAGRVVATQGRVRSQTSSRTPTVEPVSSRHHGGGVVG